MMMISVSAFNITPPEDVLARFRSVEGASPFGLCIETTFTAGQSDSECAGHMVFLPGTGALEAIVESLTHVCVTS